MKFNWCFALLLVATVLPGTARAADSFIYPAAFRTLELPSNGTTLHVRVGGAGPAVVLLHGFGETGDMWAPLAADLARDHTVIAPDLRGMGLSARATKGFDKKTQAKDIAGLMDALKVARADVVAHDIGNMVAYALAAQYPQRVTRLVLMDAPIPGIGPWEEVLQNPLLWHFRFGGPDMERLVAGRERIYLDRFWNEFSFDRTRFDEASRRHYSELYARPGNMHAGFSQFAAFDQDAKDNRAFLARGRLQMPVLAIGGDHSFAATMAYVVRFAADDVQQVVIPSSGHWLMEEQPTPTIAAIRAFLLRPSGSAGAASFAPRTLAASEVDALARGGAGPGTSGITGIQTTVLAGDPAVAGPYAIELRVPPRTRIAAHSHRDDRFARVVAGEWHFGYGNQANDAHSATLPAGSFYTEPAGIDHFAFTTDSPAVVYITGVGPTDTRYVQAKNDPRAKK
jgi:pimeloyl-ACP methyl ester carboxylesterase/quercetin dioxygenase-like cupin family protein